MLRLRFRVSWVYSKRMSSGALHNHGEEEEAPIQPPIDSESWCRTKVRYTLPRLLYTALTQVGDDVKHVFAWTIEKFSERQEPNSQVKSIQGGAAAAVR